MFVNSFPICAPLWRIATLGGMGKRERLPPTREQLEDARRLRAKWDAYKQGDPKTRTQTWLAEQCGWNTQGAANQYLNGQIALNLRTLLRLSEIMGFNPADVSPALAEQLPKYNTAEKDPQPYSAEARAAAEFIDSRPPEKRASMVMALRILAGEASEAALER